MGKHRPVLVTGGGGQVGKAFKRVHPEAVVLDRASLDITDSARVKEVLSQVRPSVIVNAAAFTRVDAAEAEVQLARRINVDAVLELARAATRAGALLVHLSTDYVFSGDKRGRYVEEDPTRPRSVYGQTKLASEKAARSAGEHLIVRTSWVFGDGTNFIRSILSAARKLPELTVVDDQRGLPTYAVDLAEAVDSLIAGGARGLFHVAGGGEPASWAEVAETAVGAAGLDVRIRRVTSEQYYSGKPGPIAPRPANSALDWSKAQRFGIDMRPWTEAVPAYLKELDI
jgi:dTDP-4-dehydrorhamnose reductase